VTSSGLDSRSGAPITVALVDDYDVVLSGLASMIDRYRDRVMIAEIDANETLGRGEGLTDREAEILALITQGKSNAEVATLTFLSPNTVKSYIRTIYRKIDVASRTQAVLWGVDHGFTPDHHRIDHWRGGP
jgi:DNA-binding CsgD family transcriptional regulator